MSEKNLIITNAINQGRTALTEIEAKQVFKDIGVPVVETRLATSRKQAGEIGAAIGFPVVLKIASVDIIHKSDAGGVKVGLKNRTKWKKPTARL